MSDIKVGDLVMVVRPTTCCGVTKFMGNVFKVVELLPEQVDYECYFCRKSAAWPIARRNSEGGHFLPELKRIPPLEQLETVTTEEFEQRVRRMQESLR